MIVKGGNFVRKRTLTKIAVDNWSIERDLYKHNDLTQYFLQDEVTLKNHVGMLTCFLDGKSHLTALLQQHSLDTGSQNYIWSMTGMRLWN